VTVAELLALAAQLGPELELLDESIHALLAARAAENKNREQQVAAVRAVDEAAVDALEKAVTEK
jgi:hypothetical protein